MEKICESFCLKRSINEVEYWLKENNKVMDDDGIVQIAEEALTLFIDKDYSSLEAAVEVIMANRRM